MDQTKTVFNSIIEFLLGKKYYANIVITRGSTRRELSSFIHRSRADAEKHRKQLESNTSFAWEETITFRSRNDY